jgi:hypothetical protein
MGGCAWLIRGSMDSVGGRFFILNFFIVLTAASTSLHVRREIIV